jgi:tetratricopeptide (TPR) repeat protein
MANDSRPTSLRLIALLVCLGITLLFGCSALQRATLPNLPENLPPSRELTGVPFYPQDEYQCGPAALAMALSRIGPPTTPNELTDQVYSPSRKGSLQISMVTAVRRHAKIAYEIGGAESLFSEIAAGQPVIILQNLGLSWLPVWHYAVVIGYDVPQQEVILRSGTTRRKVMSYLLFEKTWARGDHWGLMVLAPDQIPVSAKENTYLTAVLGLEKANQYPAAVTGYRAALTRWPNSLNARMGLGNSYYRLGDLKGAESAFREATELQPQSAPAFNNLAYVLFEQRRLKEALAAAQTAVDLGGPLQPEAEKTLQEIKSRMP